MAAPVRKRPVNLTLNEDVVRQARKLTDNLSSVVENLLTDFIEREQERLRQQSQQAQETVSLWQRFEQQHGSFADDHTTL